jgi:hypothetical protein
MVDPRQIRARLLGLSGGPAASEITVLSACSEQHDAVLVRVPAFGASVEPGVRSRLMVRLVDRRTARSSGHAPLVSVPAVPGTGSGAFYEAAVPLCGLSLSDLRVDIYDALSPVPPVGADSALHDVRRAVLLLAGWRRLVGSAELPVAFSPTTQLRELGRRLGPDAGPGDELETLLALGDAELGRRMRSGWTGPGVLPALAHGTAGLLVAELAAAHSDGL